MGQTSKYNIRYPEAGDMADVPADMKNMAEDIETAMGGKLSKTGDTMSGNLTMSNAVIKITNGREKGIQNESGIPIVCDFANQNVTLDATGKELFLGYRNTTGINFLNYKVSIDSNGNVAANNFTGKWNGYTDALPNLGHVANVLDTTITKGFGTYNANTSNIPSGFFQYGSVLFLPTASSSPNGHIVMLFGNNESANGRIAIAYYVNGEFTGWNYIKTRNNITTGTEIATNEYLDNKQIYQKTIKITSLNTGISQHQHGISNFGELIDIRGTGYWSGQGWQPIQRVVTDNIGPYGLGLGDVNSTKFMLQVGTSYTGFQKAYITLKYTKK